MAKKKKEITEPTVQEKYEFLLKNLHRVDIDTYPSFDPNTDHVACTIRSFSVNETARVLDTRHNWCKELDDMIKQEMERLK